MDDHRAQTYVVISWTICYIPTISSYSLQSLEIFIETQRALLARQREDIETLRQLKTDLAQQPSKTISRLNKEVLFFPHPRI